MSVQLPRGSSGSSSPEFEFWMVGIPSSDHLLTADELFSGGVLRPLHHIPHSEPTSFAASSHSSPPPSPPPSFPSKRWKDLFKAGFEKKDNRKRDRKDSTTAAAAAEPNIKIWPFSRSHSAGGVTKTRPAGAPRKASSAPCSRSNSCGDSSSRPAIAKGSSVWAGIHLGRSRPVWQLRQRIKEKKKSNAAAASGGGGGGVTVRMLNLKVNTCIGYRNQLSCGVSSGEEDAASGDAIGGGAGGRLFSLRTILFGKKVY